MRNLIHGVACPAKSFLLNGGTLHNLKESYHIDIRRHGRYPNLVQLKYNMIASPMGDPLVQECRGLILDEDCGWNVVAWPFKKFFNYGEGHAAQIDWTTARVQRKEDGSLIIMYWYDDEWQVATSGMPDAAGFVQGTGKLFSQLFWETWYAKKMVTPPGINHGHTFMFELTSPYNRVVVPHATADITLIGMRSIYSGLEAPIASRVMLNPVRQYDLRSFDAILSTFQTMDPVLNEGYVVVDDSFGRVKVKHPGYVALHHMKSSFSVKRLVEVIRHGESEEVLVHFPEWTTPFEQVKAAYDGLVTALKQDYDELKSFDDRKDFALAAKLSPWPATHFLLRDGNYSNVEDTLKEVHIEKMVDLLGVRGLVLEGAI